jgi:DNA (cytosine-5)-methyltransferase 1
VEVDDEAKVMKLGSKILEPISKQNSLEKVGIIELFAGAAGLAQGFLQTAKYDLLALSDIDEVAKQVFQHNFSGPQYISSDIRDLQPKQILDAAGGRKIVGLLGGPPCQGFSLAGKKNPHDSRNLYIKEYLRFVHTLAPDFIVMENVPQLLFHELFETLRGELSKKYEMKFAILNSALYGVPQTRHRAFILGYHRRLKVSPRFPNPSHTFTDRPVYSYYHKKLAFPGNSAFTEILGADPVISKMPELIASNTSGSKKLHPLITIEDAISDLQGLACGSFIQEYLHEAQTDFQKKARKGSGKTLLNHSARYHSQQMLKLINLIPEGGDLRDVNKKYWPKSFYSQAYGRLHRKGLARTLTTFFSNPGSGRFVHPVDNRAITVREAARLQGFQDRFEFFGSQADQMRLIGNAVPVPLASALANQIWADIGCVISGPG